jgi:hypothetical protein
LQKTVLISLLLGSVPVSAAEKKPFDFAAAQQVFQEFCLECHDGASAEAGFAVQSLASADAMVKVLDRWHSIRRRVADRSMPPVDAEPIPDARRDALITWIDATLLEAICRDGPQPGPPLLRRLTKQEYAHSIRDLLGIHFDAGHALPQDAAGGEGFNNAAETLTISPIHAEKYLDAAVDALNYAAHSESARTTLLVKRPSEERSATATARHNLRRFAERAFRRPTTDREIDRLVSLFESAAEDGLDFEEATFYAMRAVLVSPHFLFIAETPPPPGETVPLTDHELATRLSYFLWASTPDDKLLQLADAGRLHDDQVLREQVIRMIGGRQTRFRDSMSRFVGQWLGTADLGGAKAIDRQRHDWIQDPHIAALRNQPVYVFESIVRENNSLLELIDADWTFLNHELVRVYGLKRDRLEGEFVQRLVRVGLPEEYRRRGGLLGMGGIHAITAYPARTSPVLRGVWVLEKLLGTDLPPPPPDVPSLEEDATVARSSTLRERLQRHREDARCASCHDAIDPIGFALENFDEIGRWRTEDDGGEIDATATLRDGTQLAGLDGLKRHVLQEKEAFLRQLTRKMLGYALGRGLQPADLCSVEMILTDLKNADYAAQTLIQGIVDSPPFRMKRVKP